MAKNLTAKIYMVGSTAGIEVEIKDKEKDLVEYLRENITLM